MTFSDTPNKTTLNGAINAGATFLSVNSERSLPGSRGYVIKIGDELLLVEDSKVKDLRVVRGYNGTTAAAHSDAAVVTLQSEDAEVANLVEQDDFTYDDSDDPEFTTTSAPANGEITAVVLEGAVLQAADFEVGEADADGKVTVTIASATDGEKVSLIYSVEQ